MRISLHPKLSNIFLGVVHRVSGGIYEVTVEGFDEASHELKKMTYVIDAVKAIREIQKVNCGGEVYCSASENFQSSIVLTKK